jgi:hypothetical protein
MMQYFPEGAIHACREPKPVNEPAETLEIPLANPAIHSWSEARYYRGKLRKECRSAR